MLIPTSLQTLPSRNYATACAERAGKHRQLSAKPNLSSSSRASGRTGGCSAVARRHHRGSEVLLVFPANSEGSLPPVGSDQHQHVVRACKKVRGGRGPLAATSPLANHPPSLKESHLSADTSGLQCLTLRSLPAKQATGSCSPASWGRDRADLLGAGLC